jgi:hypothetical protein
MTEPSAPQRIALIWSPEARADLRAINRDTAMQILYCIERYLASRTGDVKKLKPPLTGFRLRTAATTGFSSTPETTIQSQSPPSAIAARPTAKPSLLVNHAVPPSSAASRKPCNESLTEKPAPTAP